MFRLRRIRALSLVVAVLAVVLAIRLVRAGHHGEPPWPMSSAHPAPHSASDVRGPARAPEHATLDLLPLSIPRSNDGVEPNTRQQIGPRWIGTDNEAAARLLEEARTAIEKGENNRALDLAHRGLELDSGFPQLLVIGASAALACGEAHVPEAKLLARLAVVRAPMYPEAHYNLACAQARQGRAADATASLAEARSWGEAGDLDVVGAARNDPDFDRVRGSPEMQALLQQR